MTKPAVTAYSEAWHPLPGGLLSHQYPNQGAATAVAAPWFRVPASTGAAGRVLAPRPAGGGPPGPDAGPATIWLDPYAASGCTVVP
jgi:hypothetical protein